MLGSCNEANAHSPHPARCWSRIFFPHDNWRAIGEVAFAGAPGDERVRVGNDDGRLLVQTALVAPVRLPLRLVHVRELFVRMPAPMLMRLLVHLLIVAVAATVAVIVPVAVMVAMTVIMAMSWRRRGSVSVPAAVRLAVAIAVRAKRWGGRRGELWLQVERRALAACEEGFEPDECARRQRQYAHEEHEYNKSNAGTQRRVEVDLTLRRAPHCWGLEGNLNGRVAHRREGVCARRCMHQQLQRKGEGQGEGEEEAQPERIMRGCGRGWVVQGNLEADADEEHGEPVKAHGDERDEAEDLVAEERRVEARCR